MYRKAFPGLRNTFLILVCYFFLLMFSGCSPKTANHTLPIDTPETFSGSGDQELPDKWWTVFDNDRLDTVVSRALSSNFNVKIAWHRMQASRAVVKRESSYLWPGLESNLQGGLQYPTPDFVGGENMQIGLASVYEVDLWGRISSRVQAEKFRAEASMLDYQTAAISLSGEIVRVWYQLMAEQRRLAIIQEQIQNNKKTLNLLNARFAGGQIRSTDILRQKQVIASAENQKVDTETRIRVLENQLAVLSGKPPQDTIGHGSDSLPGLPALPETGVPADLVQRRPDVQNAFFRLKAADREVAAAISDQYPRLSLNATMAIRSNTVDNIFQTWARTFTANLTGPLLYAGRLRAEADRTRSVKKQRLYQYGQAVLTAFQEVENALIREKKQKESIANLQEQYKLASQSYTRLKTQYFNGVTGYLDVLTALNEKQQLRRDLITAKLSLMQNRIALYRALAGGVGEQ